LATLSDFKKMIRLLRRRPLNHLKDSQEAFKEDKEKISLRRIQKILQKAGYKSRHSAQKFLLTERIKLQRMEFTTSHLNCFKMMFKGELTFRLVCVCEGGLRGLRGLQEATDLTRG